MVSYQYDSLVAYTTKELCFNGFKVAINTGAVRILTVVGNHRENGVRWNFLMLACHSHGGWNRRAKRIVTAVLLELP